MFIKLINVYCINLQNKGKKHKLTQNSPKTLARNKHYFNFTKIFKQFFKNMRLDYICCFVICFLIANIK